MNRIFINCFILVLLTGCSSSSSKKEIALQTLQHETIVIPNMSSCDGAVYVSGDSMYPLLKSGDIIGFKEISDFQHLIYGEMYLVSFCLDGNDYLVVKYVNRSEVSGCIQLVSYNPHHQPMDLPIENIQAMAIVKFSIRKNMM